MVAIVQTFPHTNQEVCQWEELQINSSHSGRPSVPLEFERGDQRKRPVDGHILLLGELTNHTHKKMAPSEIR